MLTALLPPRPDAKTLAVTSNDSQWAGVLSVREDDEAARQQPVKESDVPVDDEDDIYAYGDDPPPPTKGDWFGIDRDRRSAYLVMGGLRSEGLLSPRLRLRSCSILRFDDVARVPKDIPDYLKAIPSMSVDDVVYQPQSTFTRIANSSSMPLKKPKGSHCANWYCFGLRHVARNAQ
ncbi:hypothetical protein EYR40_005212 [Pleurotus pulmonarius]|nr:hypothetical protein EYR40_005212 [Pleurotus pulmonarius]